MCWVAFTMRNFPGQLVGAPHPAGFQTGGGYIYLPPYPLLLTLGRQLRTRCGARTARRRLYSWFAY